MQKTGDLSRQLFPPEKLATAIVIVLMRLRSITRGIISSGTKCDYQCKSFTMELCTKGTRKPGREATANVIWRLLQHSASTRANP
jgi:hypothetical protein